jgi:hypothetical protein
MVIVQNACLVFLLALIGYYLSPSNDTNSTISMYYQYGNINFVLNQEHVFVDYPLNALQSILFHLDSM